jgi:hypothetical protein
VLYVGTGCPSWAESFGCLVGNDNTGDNGGTRCASNELASTLSLRRVPSRTIFIQVGGMNGAPIVSGLSWSYVVRSSSATPTVSSSRTRSRSTTPKRK